MAGSPVKLSNRDMPRETEIKTRVQKSLDGAGLVVSIGAAEEKERSLTLQTKTFPTRSKPEKYMSGEYSGGGTTEMEMYSFLGRISIKKRKKRLTTMKHGWLC